MKSLCLWGAAVLIAALALTPRQVEGAASNGAAIESANVEAGKRLFMKSGCYQCHGMVGQGSIVTGPRLAPDPIPLEAFLFYVRKPTGQMPPYTQKVLSDRELSDIHAFLESIPQPPSAKSLTILE